MLMKRKQLMSYLESKRKEKVITRDIVKDASTTLTDMPSSSKDTSYSTLPSVLQNITNIEVQKELPEHMEVVAKKSNIIQLETPTFMLYCAPELDVFKKEGTLMDITLQRRLIRCTIDNMVSGCNNLTIPRRPSKQELTDMAYRLCNIYPSLKDMSAKQNAIYINFYKRLQKRLLNIRRDKKKQGLVPKRSRFYNLNKTPPTNNEIQEDAPEQDVMFDIDDNQNELIPSADERNMAQLSAEMKKKKPKEDVVKALLYITFAYRIDEIRNSTTENRVDLLFNKYSSFKAFPKLVLDEVSRIINKDLDLDTCISKLETTMNGIKYYGLAEGKLTLADFKSKDSPIPKVLLKLEDLFPSSMDKKKKSKVNDDTTIYSLKLNQSPEKFCKGRLNAPGLVIGCDNHMVLIGSRVFSNHDDLDVAFMVFLGLFYVLDLDYPQSHVLAFSLLQQLVFDHVIDCATSHVYNEVLASIQRFI